MENNYYLDLNARTIDSEIKWSEYKYIDNSVLFPGGTLKSNKEAFESASKNYYYLQLSSYMISQYIEFRLDTTEPSLDRHAYTVLGSDSVVEYKAKWF